MNDAEQAMSRVWARIIGEVRGMRGEKYTLERIGAILGVSKPTVQRWLESGAGGEKTAFIDIMRYLSALNIDLRDLLYGAEATLQEKALALELENALADRQRLTLDLVGVQKELLAAKQSIIELQEKNLGLEKLNAAIADKARKAIIAAASSGRKAAAAPERTDVAPPAQEPAQEPAQAHSGKRRLAPGRFPDLPPIHLQQDK